MKSIEINSFSDNPTMFCLKCGKNVIKIPDESIDIDPCEHLMFVANDEGFEYIADDTWQDGYENSEEDLSIVEYFKKLDVDDGVIIESYSPAPSFLGAYFGFKFEES
jgi:hypothetical protein